MKASPEWGQANVALHEFDATDMGNAQRFIKDHSVTLKACGKKWLVQKADGGWEVDCSGEEYRRAMATIRQMCSYADIVGRESRSVWAQKSKSLPRINAMLRLASAELQVSRDEAAKLIDKRKRV